MTALAIGTELIPPEPLKYERAPGSSTALENACVPPVTFPAASKTTIETFALPSRWRGVFVQHPAVDGADIGRVASRACLGTSLERGARNDEGPALRALRGT